MPWIALDPSTAAAAPVTTAGAPLTSIGDTLLGLRTDLKNQLAQRADVDSTQLTRWINRAYRHLCAMLPLPDLKFSFSLTLALDQPFYLLPKTNAGWTSVASIKQAAILDASIATGGAPLDFIDEQQYRDLPDIPGTYNIGPRKFLRHRDMVAFWPTPLGSITAVFDSRVRPQDLSADTDSPILPPEWHEGILLAARYRALRDKREWKEAAIANNDFVAFIRVLQDNEAEEQGEQEVHMVPTRSTRYSSILISRWIEEDRY